MRALAIAPQPFFTCRETPLSMYYRTLMTAELGVEVDLLTYGEGEAVDIPGVNIIRIPRFKWLGPVKIGPSALKHSHTQVLDESVAFLVEPTPQGMAEGMLQATRSPNALAISKVKKAQKLYEQKYSRRIYKDKMRVVLERLAVPMRPEVSASRGDYGDWVGVGVSARNGVNASTRSRARIRTRAED